MLIAIVLLLGMMNIVFAMEPIPADSGNNPFIQDNTKVYLTPLTPACIPLQPTAPLIENDNITDDITAVLIKNGLLSQDYKFEANKPNWKKSFKKALDQKSIANQKKQLADLYEVFKEKPSLLGHKDAVDEVYKRCLTQENGCTVEQFFDECIILISHDHNKIKNKPWTLSENLNHAFGLIHEDINNLVFDWDFKKITLGYVSCVGFIFLAIFKPRLVHKNSFIALVSFFSLYKGLLAHSAPVTYVPRSSSQKKIIGDTQKSICQCHNKKNNTLKCAYRLIYCGLGSLLFLYIFFKRA